MTKSIQNRLKGLFFALVVVLLTGLGNTVQAADNAVPYISTHYLTNATVNVFHSQPISAFDDNKADSLTLTNSSLPQGLSMGNCTTLTANTRRRLICYLSGTPVATPGVYPVTITVTDNNGASSSKEFTIKIKAGPNYAPYITTAYLSNATVGSAYSQPVISLDANELDTLTLTSTALPQGLSLGNCTTMTANTRRRLLCYISGTPTQAGIYPVTLTITDNKGASSSKDFTLKVKPALVQPTIDLVTAYYCGSSSCADITTVQVDGTGYDANARVEATGQTDGLTYSGQLVGGNMSTTILTDFDSLPCQIYSVRVYFTTDSREVTGVNAFQPAACN